MEKAATVKEPLCKQKIHRKVLDKGVPEDAMPGIKNIKVNKNENYNNLCICILGRTAFFAFVRNA